MRRIVATVAAIAVVMSSAALAAVIDCPTMRARGLAHCCCPPGGQEHARLTCCKDIRDSKVVTTSAREQTERVQMVPPSMVVAVVEPTDGFQGAAFVFRPGTPPSTADPPPVPLRI